TRSSGARRSMVAPEACGVVARKSCSARSISVWACARTGAAEAQNNAAARINERMALSPALRGRALSLRRILGRQLQQMRIAALGGDVDADSAFLGETRQIIWAAGFGAGAGEACAAEGLNADHRANDSTVHIDVAGLHCRLHRFSEAFEARVNA